jgi:hypothetical protein
MSLQASFIKHCKAVGINPEGDYADYDARPAFAAGYKAAVEGAFVPGTKPGSLRWVTADDVLADALTKKLEYIMVALGTHLVAGETMENAIRRLVKVADDHQHELDAQNKKGWDDALDSVARSLSTPPVPGRTLEAVRDLVARNKMLEIALGGVKKQRTADAAAIDAIQEALRVWRS